MEYENPYGDEVGPDDELRWVPEGLLDDEYGADYGEPGWEIDDLSDEPGLGSSDRS